MILDTLSTLLVSFYSPTSNVEKFAGYILIVCINTNSVLFLLTFILFVFSYKNHLQDLVNKFKNQKINEFFIDIEENTKNML